ncbi:MAG: hypothetical protein ACRDD1_17800, partial [Planctomycetia bacterium]
GPFDSVSPVERSVGRAVWDAAALGVFRRPGVAGAAFRTAANTRGAALFLTRQPSSPNVTSRP